MMHDNGMDLLSEGCPTFSLAHLAAISFVSVVANGVGQSCRVVEDNESGLCYVT
jgi:hypothetical protein